MYALDVLKRLRLPLDLHEDMLDGLPAEGERLDADNPDVISLCPELNGELRDQNSDLQLLPRVQGDGRSGRIQGLVTMKWWCGGHDEGKREREMKP